jgi:hypothetical protein
VNSESTPNHDPRPYMEVTDATFAQLAAKTFALEKQPKGILLLRGPCPRCNGIIDIPIVDRIFRTSHSRHSGLRSQPRSEHVVPRVEPMICNCDHSHPDRPKDRVGCGAYWILEIPGEAPQV